MSRSFLTIFLAIMGPLAVGCASKKKPATPPPAWPVTSPESAATIREAYHKEYPNSRVGVVTAVRGEDHLVAVGDVPGNEFQLGQVVTFIDSQQRVLTTGTVVRILPDGVHASYEPPVVGQGREPRVGDLMVRF